MVSIITLLGSMIAIGATGAYFMLPKSIEMLLPKILNLEETGLLYQAYMKGTGKVRSSYMIFEITNKDQVINGGKPKLRVRGPISFESVSYKDNISFHNEGESIRYNTQQRLYLDEEASEDLDVKFWMFNPVVVTLADQVNEMVINRVPFKAVVEPIVFNSVNLFLERFNEKVIMHRSPRDLFVGTKLDILEFVASLSSQFGLVSGSRSPPPDTVFGIAHAMNKSVDNIELYTGVGRTRSRFAEVISWRGHKVLPYWKGKCNIIEGTNGELYKPFVNPNKQIKIFLGAACRSMLLDPVTSKMVKLSNGLHVYEYTMSQRNYQAPANNAANECYCPESSGLECQVDGLIRVAPCLSNTPILLARPNMTGVHPLIRSTIADELLNASKLHTRQNFWLDPVTSLPLKADITVMVVLKVVPQYYINEMDKLQAVTYSPVVAVIYDIQTPPEIVGPMQIFQKMYMDHKPMSLAGMAAGLVITLLGLMLPKSKKKKKVKSNLVTPAGGKGAHLPQGNPVIMTEEGFYDDGDDYSGSYMESDRRSTHSGRSRQTVRSARSARSVRSVRSERSVRSVRSGSHRTAQDQYSNRGHQDDFLRVGRPQRPDYSDGHRSKSARLPEDRLGEPRMVDNMRRSARLYPQDYNYNYEDQDQDQDRADEDDRRSHLHRASARSRSSRLASGSDSGKSADHQEPARGLRRQKSHSPLTRRRSARRRASSAGH